MLRSYGSGKQINREVFENKRKSFDRCIETEKINFWKNTPPEIENLIDTDNREFQKTIGCVGVGEQRKKSIPLEIIIEDGSLPRDRNLVMNKWRDSFNIFFLNPVIGNTREHEE